ncbi:hypothetical protein A2U01_0050141 [Trifolium medium]|uniref:Uncharacterized protein n=1 Tax=Trifolium medium TaxID=97028 RepID=A0A392QXB9_9FABA|nr:hypothetical protein [Trifolium medium]
MEEEEKKKQEEEHRLKDTSGDIVIETSEHKDKGKAVATEHDPLVLMLQEQLATQKADQEQLKEDVKNLTESQQHVLKTQDDMNQKLDAILKFMASKP